MRIYYWLLTLLILPDLCAGADLAVMDSPDWHPMAQAQIEVITKQATQVGGRLVDGSIPKDGKGGATTLAVAVKPGVDKVAADNFVASFVRGVVETGPKLTDREPAQIGPLRGTSIRFQTEVKGQQLTMIAYIVFTNREAYNVSCYVPGLRLARIPWSRAICPGSKSMQWPPRGMLIRLPLIQQHGTSARLPAGFWLVCCSVLAWSLWQARFCEADGGRGLRHCPGCNRRKLSWDQPFSGLLPWRLPATKRIRHRNSGRTGSIDTRALAVTLCPKVPTQTSA